MSTKLNLLLLLFFCALVVGGQAQEATIKGRVTDAGTGEGLIGASIAVGTAGTVTDIDGYYSLQVPAGRVTAKFSYVGYQPVAESFSLVVSEQKQLDVALEVGASLLQTATVTSGKYEKPLGELTVSLEILQPNLIENTSKTTLDKALEKVPGVTIIDGQANIRSGSGFSQGAGSRVLLLVDDVPILQADAGFPNWDDVPIENIAQVEVLKGAASALYGSSALNGIINVRTAFAKSEPETKIATFYTHVFSPEDKSLQWWDKAPATYAASITHRQKFGKLDLVVGAFYLNEQSFNQDTYKRFGRFNFNTRYRISDRLTIGMSGNFNQGSSGNFFYWKSDKEPFTGAASTINARERLRFNLDPQATYFDQRGNRHRFLGRLYSVSNDNDLNQSNNSDLFYGEYQFQRKFSTLDLVATAGIVGSGTDIRAELYGDTTFTSQNLAAYAQLERKFFERLNVSAGFRYEYNVLNNPGFVYSGGVVDPSEEEEARPVFRVGANYQVAKATYIRASWGQGYRFPTVAEKFIVTDAGGFNILPNPALGSETGWTGELGVKQGFRIGTFEGFVDVAAFAMRFEDMMEFSFISMGFQSAFRSVNIGRTSIDGYEISLAGRGKIGAVQTSFLAGYTYADPRFLDFDSTPVQGGMEQTPGQINFNNSSNKDTNVMKYRSRHLGKFDAEAQYKRVTLGWEIFHNSHLEAIDAIFNLIVTGLANFREENNKGFTVHSVRAAYNVTPKLRFNFILGNVFNTLYTQRPALMESPRNLTARMDWQF